MLAKERVEPGAAFRFGGGRQHNFLGGLHTPYNDVARHFVTKPQ